MAFNLMEKGMFGEAALQHMLRQRFRNETAAAQGDPHGFSILRGARDGEAAGSRVSGLEQIMQLDEKSTSYMRQEKYYEAYGLLNSQYKLGPKVHFAPVLVKYYVTLMQTDRGDKADKIRNELAELLREKFADSADDVCLYAEDLSEKSKHWEAILFFQIALRLNDKSKSMIEPAHVLQLSASGLTKAMIKIFLEKPAMKKILKQHVIGWIKKARDQVVKEVPNDKMFSSLIQSNMLSQEARCLFMFRDFESAIKKFKEAISLMERHHESDADNFSNFAEYLGHLGLIYNVTNQLDEAEKYLRRSIAAAKNALDTSAHEISDSIKMHEAVLKTIIKRREQNN